MVSSAVSSCRVISMAMADSGGIPAASLAVGEMAQEHTEKQPTALFIYELAAAFFKQEGSQPCCAYVAVNSHNEHQPRLAHLRATRVTWAGADLPRLGSHKPKAYTCLLFINERAASRWLSMACERRFSATADAVSQ